MAHSVYMAPVSQKDFRGTCAMTFCSRVPAKSRNQPIHGDTERPVNIINHPF